MISYICLISIIYKTTNVTPAKGDAEVLEFSFGTPVASGDTIKRAKMKTAETDSYKGHVARVKDDRPLSDSAVSKLTVCYG